MRDMNADGFRISLWQNPNIGVGNKLLCSLFKGYHNRLMPLDTQVSLCRSHFPVKKALAVESRTPRPAMGKPTISKCGRFLQGLTNVGTENVWITPQQTILLLLW